ncbi:MAG: PPOX class F420-dependent oxidoreductase [Actinomycetales bacterium]
MSDEALRSILAVPGRTGVLTTIKRDGRPQLSVVVHAYETSTATLRISVTADRAKTRNVARDPRVSYLVMGENRWQYVVAEGLASLGSVTVDPDDAAADDLVSLYRQIAGEHEDWRDYRAAMVAQRRQVLSIAVERVYGLAG